MFNTCFVNLSFVTCVDCARNVWQSIKMNVVEAISYQPHHKVQIAVTLIRSMSGFCRICQLHRKMSTAFYSFIPVTNIVKVSCIIVCA